MKGVKVSGEDIQKALKVLREKELIDRNYKPHKEDDILIIPIVDDVHSFEMVDFDFESKDKKLDFKEEVEKILEDSEKDMLKTAYDIVGTIAVLEIDELLHSKAKDIGEILLKCNHNIKTVVRKKGKHEGQLRIQDYEVLAGDDILKTVHKENGCRLAIEINKVYYSSRSATERKRVFSQVKPGEKVLVMFSGCGPFTCTIAKNTEASEVCGIELNKDGHELAEESKRINKLSNVININGDVREVCSDLKEQGKVFDRIAMPLPMTAEEFLPQAFMVSKSGTIIHLYDFKDEKVFPEETISQIDKYCKAAGLEYEILESVKCGQFSPSVYRVCVDFKIK